MQKAIRDHFSCRNPPSFYYLLTFVNNSKDPLDQVLFTIGRVNDWFRKHKDLARSWFIVQETHKDGRNHYHAIADLNYKQFKPSSFVFKVNKKVLRIHIQVRVNGSFVSSTFSAMSKSAGCKAFIEQVNRIRFRDGDIAYAKPVSSDLPNRHLVRTAPELLAYLTKHEHGVGDLARYRGWCCSCRVDHTSLDNLFSQKFVSNSILSRIFEYLR